MMQRGHACWRCRNFLPHAVCDRTIFVFDELPTMQHDTLPPPDPETWQATEPVDRWTANTRGFEHVPDTVPDFDALTDEAIRSAG